MKGGAGKILIPKMAKKLFSEEDFG